MKNLYLIITMILTLAFLLIPLLATEKRQNEGVFSNSTSIISIESDTKNLRFEKLSEIKLFCVNTKKILPLKVEEYVLGVVAAEMPSEYHIEALKAQALAAYTYAYKKHLEGSEKLNEYDLTNDSTIDQRYADESARKTKWGEKFNENETRIKTAVSEILEEIIVYNDKPILAVYHAISPTFFLHLVNVNNFTSSIIGFNNFFITTPLLRHIISSKLAHSNSVSISAYGKNKGVAFIY